MTQGLRKLLHRPESISNQVYEAIRDAIVDKTLPPGQLVTEVGLARELAVSRTPVRDALLRLREQRLILGDSQQGLRVVYATREAIAHAYETRPPPTPTWPASPGTPTC
jgi:GntR family transcriptional regulator, rspAB operon transcriptional repressor